MTPSFIAPRYPPAPRSRFPNFLAGAGPPVPATATPAEKLRGGERLPQGGRAAEPRRQGPAGAPVQGGQVVAVGRGVAGVGDDADDGAAQRGALQEPAAHQLHVARRVHAGPHGGAGQQDALVGEQQRQAAGDLDGAARRHGRPLRPAAPPAHGPAPPATGTREGPAGPGGAAPRHPPPGGPGLSGAPPAAGPRPYLVFCSVVVGFSPAWG